jgi:hypothetical protein
MGSDEDGQRQAEEAARFIHVGLQRDYGTEVDCDDHSDIAAGQWPERDAPLVAGLSCAEV